MNKQFFVSAMGLITVLATANVYAATPRPYKHRLVKPPPVVAEGVNNVAFSVGGSGARFIEPELKQLMNAETFPLSGKDLDIPSYHPAVSTKIFTVVTPDSKWNSALWGNTSVSKGSRKEVKKSEPDKDGKVTTYYYTFGTYKVEAEVEWKSADGTVLHSANLLKSGEVRDTSTKGYPPVPDVTPFVKREFERFAGELVYSMRPRWSIDTVGFRMDRSVGKLMRSFYKKRNGISLGQLYGSLQGLLKADSYNATATNNLGVVLLLAGALDEAKEKFEQAVSFESNCRVCYDNVKATEARMAEADSLAVQGIIVRGSPPEGGAGQAQAMSGSGGKIKGGRASRVPLFAAADYASDTIAQLPGGLAVQILGKEGGFTKVRAPDGKEGFVPSKDVK